MGNFVEVKFFPYTAHKVNKFYKITIIRIYIFLR